MVRYFCVFPTKIINLKAPRVIIEEGFKTRIPGLRIKFENHMFDTEKLGDRAKEAEKIIERLISIPGGRYGTIIHRYEERVKQMKEGIEAQIDKLLKRKKEIEKVNRGVISTNTNTVKDEENKIPLGIVGIKERVENEETSKNDNRSDK